MQFKREGKGDTTACFIRSGGFEICLLCFNGIVKNVCSILSFC